MSNPIERLRRGLQNGDWAEVSLGFKGLTGEDVPPPFSGVPDDRKADALLAIRDIAERALEDFASVEQEREVGEEEEEEDDDEVAQPPLAPLLDPPKPKPKPGVDLNQFKIDHGEQKRADGKSYAKTVEIPNGPNRFVDDGRLAKRDIALDQLMSGELSPSERRDPPQKVKVFCEKCDKSYMVDPIFAPKRFASDDETTFICDNCLKGKTRKKRRGE